MFPRTHRSLIVLFFSFALAVSFNLLHAETTKAEEAEAQELYTRANDYVSNVGESGYSYAYIQFYWKRAQANLDRIVRVYPETKIGRELRSNELKIGLFDLPYFKDRVLPRLEEKKLGAYDAINCAIFLYNLDEKRQDAERATAFQSIIEVLCRQKRWNEALVFPTLDPALLHATVFRVAARYNEPKVMKGLLAKATPAEKAVFWPILGEAMALTGAPRNEITRFVKDHPEGNVRLAVLSGMITREIDLQRAAALHLVIKTNLAKPHYALGKIEVRDNIEEIARALFDQPTSESQALLNRYRAATGQKPRADASLNQQLAYMDYLATADKWDELVSWIQMARLNEADRRVGELKGRELLAGRGQGVDQMGKALKLPSGNAPAQAVIFAEFRGQMNSSEVGLTVHEHTFSELKINDPCVLAQLIMEWALAPNQAIRGAAPWDSVVQLFLPGYDHLPLPKSKAVQDASSASKPF